MGIRTPSQGATRAPSGPPQAPWAADLPREAAEESAVSTEDLRNQVEQLRLLRTLTLELSATLDEQELAPKILQAAVTALHAEGGSLWVAHGGTLTCRLASGPDSDQLVGMEMPIEDAVGVDAPETDASVIAAPMVAQGSVVGALRVSRKLPGDASFSMSDRHLLGGLAASAAIALRNAARFRDADRSGDLALVMEMSREITATLHLDRVLRAVVNLAMRMLSFDRGAVALYERGECEIRAVAGADQVNPADPALQDVAARAAFAAGMGESFYLSDRRDPGSDAERIFVQMFGGDLELADVESGLYLPLTDEEGVVGILLFEAERPDFASERQRELATILANETTVAIRNAQLYSHVPLAETLGAFSAKKKAFLAIPRRRRIMYAAAVVAAVAAVTLVRWPLRVPGAEPTFRPTGRAEVRALVPGIVERVFVREGTRVRRGDPVAELRDTELRAERDAAADAAAAADRAAALAASRGDAGEEQLQRVRAETLRREMMVLDEQLRSVLIRTPVSGVVLTPRPEEQLGASIEEGDVVVLVGRSDTLELEFAVDQRDIARVRIGDEVRLRVDALPQRTFIGRVTSLGSIPIDAVDGVSFPVRALIPNSEGLLRPGMEAYARVLSEPASLLGRVLRDPVRQARLLWWRIWS